MLLINLKYRNEIKYSLKDNLFSVNTYFRCTSEYHVLNAFALVLRNCRRLRDLFVNAGEEIVLDKSYWMKKVAEPLPSAVLPTDYQQGTGKEFMEGTIIHPIKQELLLPLYDFSIKQDTDPNVVLLASYILWVYFSTNEEDILIGNAMKESEGITPIRIDFQKNRTVNSLLSYLQEQLEENRKHEVLSPITFDKFPNWQTVFQIDQSIDVKTELAWRIQFEENRMVSNISYNQNLFKKESIKRFIGQYEKIIETIIQEDPQLPFDRIQMLTDEEWTLYQQLNETDAPYAKEKTISQVFYETAKKFAGNIALSSFEGQMTYRELNERSNEIAHMLISNGMKKGDYAAIVMERSMETVMSLLGILKAGGVYIPIDPSYPKERCRYLLNDTGAPFILTKHEHRPLLSNLLDNDDKRMVFEMNHMEKEFSKEDVHVECHPSDLAYIIYTSGSTGKPKGTMLRHDSVINLITDHQRIYQSTEQDVYTQFISYSFDPSVTETFTAFFSGARLYMLSSAERVSIEEFAAAIKREKATATTVPNAFFNQLATHLPKERKEALKTLKFLSVGGEALMYPIVQKWQQKFGTNIEIINVYGPTECTVLSTYHKVQNNVEESQSSIPIGRPIANYEAYIVNKHNLLCPINVPGELCIAGAGLASGYLNRPENTAEAFVPHLFSVEPHKMMYRTGDLVRLLPSGSIEFVGRKDSQIKVRGFRIEIGEIEAVLANESRIQEVVILAKKMVDGSNSLFAYYTVSGDMHIREEEIREYLVDNLPEYMVPDHFFQLDEMPLSPTGKINRKQLAAIEKAPETDTYVAPENENQQILADAWQKSLGIPCVGIRDNFFHIGGHSLKVLEILVQVKRHFPFLKIQDFFEHHTIEELDAYISQYQPVQSEAPISKKGFILKDLMEPSILPNTSTIQSRPMHTVFLTGATGYLGSHVLYEILKRTSAHVYCLIRKNSHASIDAKLEDSMHFYFGESIMEMIKERVTVIQGDLGEERLGLSSIDRSMLAEKIDAIIHCGADVRHFGDASHFNNVNIEGTKYLLELAKYKEGVHFHHVSTIGIPEELATSQWEYYLEKGDFDYEVPLEHVYNQSKLEAENIVRKAVEDLPVTIYRVGNLTCHSENGKFQRNMDDNAFYRMIKSMLHLRKTPKANWHIDFTPINYASQALVAIASKPKSNGHIFHLCNPETLTYTRFIDVLQELGYELETVESEEYEDWLLNGEHASETSEYLSLAIAQLEGDGAGDSEFIFNSKKAQEFLKSADVKCAKPNQAYIEKLIKYGIKAGYLPERTKKDVAE